MRRAAALLALPYLLASAQELSCSSEAADPCQTPFPGGLFVFQQRFEPDVGSDYGSWGIDGLEVLQCASQQAQNTTPYSPTYTHEQIGSFCHQSDLFGGEEGFLRAEGEWAQSEVGEGVEEVWERAWNTAGRYISTLDPACAAKPRTGHGVPEFFLTLRKLHHAFPTAQLLSNADITPADDTTYSLAELTEALSVGENRPLVTCDNTTLSSVLWPTLVRGTFQGSTFEPTTLDRASNCPAEGIHYQPSTTRAVPTQKSEWDILRRPPPRPITLTHDESRLYYQQQGERGGKKALGLFKDYEEGKDEAKEDRATRQFGRDEL